MQHCTVREKCRSCGSERFKDVLDMGEMPPANGFRESPDEPEASYPLEVIVCESCLLVQLRHTVDRAFLFSEYPYFSAASGSSPHFESYADELERRYLDEGDLVVDIGSNDGGLLACLSPEIDRVGVDPAENTAEVAEDRGITTVTEFFTESTAQEIRDTYGEADVLCANNVLAHVADLHEFFEGISLLLAPEGSVVIEVPYLRDLVAETQLSTIYHEHLSYFSLTSLTTLADQYDLVVTDVERLDRHGGSIRIHLRRQTVDWESSQVENLRVLERASGLTDPDALARFGDCAEEKRTTIQRLFSELTKDERVVGYGASAKGNVLLNYCDLNTDEISYIVDAMPAKQGTYSPGRGIPVRSPDAFRDDDPAYVFVLAWNYWDSILEQERAYRERGGRFVRPTPMPDIR